MEQQTLDPRIKSDNKGCSNCHPLEAVYDPQGLPGPWQQRGNAIQIIIGFKRLPEGRVEVPVPLWGVSAQQVTDRQA